MKSVGWLRALLTAASEHLSISLTNF